MCAGWNQFCLKRENGIGSLRRDAGNCRKSYFFTLRLINTRGGSSLAYLKGVIYKLTRSVTDENLRSIYIQIGFLRSNKIEDGAETSITKQIVRNNQNWYEIYVKTMKIASHFDLIYCLVSFENFPTSINHIKQVKSGLVTEILLTMLLKYPKYRISNSWNFTKET